MSRVFGLMGLIVLVGLFALASLLSAPSVFAADAAPIAVPSGIGGWLDAAANIVAAAAVVAALLPVPSRVGTGLAVIRKVIDVLAFNFGNAKNKK